MVMLKKHIQQLYVYAHMQDADSVGKHPSKVLETCKMDNWKI